MSQNLAAGGPLDEEVKKIEAKYQSIDDLSADFIQKTKIEMLGREVMKRGKIKFKKGGRLKIEYDGSGEKRYVADGKKLWVFTDGDSSSIQEFAIGGGAIPKEALSFLIGFGKLSKEFKVGESDSFGDLPAGSVALHLQPKAKDAQYKSLDALFNPDRILAELIVSNLSGNVTAYEFSEIKINTSIPDDLFARPQ